MVGGIFQLVIRRGVVRARLARQLAGRVGQQRDDLALDVEAGVVVVAELGRRDAEAGEDHRRGHLRGRLRGARPDHALVGQRHVGRRAVDRQAHRRRRRRALDERHLLEVRAVVGPGSVAGGLERRRDVAGGQLVPARRRFAAFEQVVGQKLDVGANARGRHRGVSRQPDSRLLEWRSREDSGAR